MKKNTTRLLAATLFAALSLQPLTVNCIWPFTKKTPKATTMNKIAVMLTTTKNLGVKYGKKTVNLGVKYGKKAVNVVKNNPVTSGLVGICSLVAAFVTKKLWPKMGTGQVGNNQKKKAKTKTKTKTKKRNANKRTQRGYKRSTRTKKGGCKNGSCKL